jgi:hypothetical protein
MIFSDDEIHRAIELRSLNIPWTVAPGMYIYDSDKRIKPGSPFQPHVYFLLDINCFDAYFGSRQELQDSVTWLPTWYDARKKLTELKVEDKRIAYHFAARNSIVRKTELVDLYELIASALTGMPPNYSNAD